MDTTIVDHFVKAALDSLRRDESMTTPGPLSDAMRDDSRAASSGWHPWKPIPSTVTDEQLDDLERSLGLRYPNRYRALLKTVHFVDLIEFGIRFEPHVPDAWKNSLTRLYSSWRPERIVGIGLIPFGSECLMDAGPACFDTRSMSDGDCPVVFWDHEWIGTPQEIRPLFSSVEAMFRCLAFAAQQDTRFLYHDETDDPDSLPAKRMLLEQFLALDPDIGGSARAYWTRWGVLQLTRSTATLNSTVIVVQSHHETVFPLQKQHMRRMARGIPTLDFSGRPQRD